MSKAGNKILAGLKDAIDGNFAAVTIEGQRWVRVFPEYTLPPSLVDREAVREQYARAIYEAGAGPDNDACAWDYAKRIAETYKDSRWADQAKMYQDEIDDVLAKADAILSLINSKDAALSSTTAERGAVRRLDWQETFSDRGDGSQDHTGWEADSGFGPWYDISQYFGSDSYGWKITYDSVPIGDVVDPDRAKKIAQDDFERRAQSALSVSTTAGREEADKLSDALTAEVPREEYVRLIDAIDYTLTVHGKIDADTPLHDRIRKVYRAPISGSHP